MFVLFLMSLLTVSAPSVVDCAYVAGQTSGYCLNSIYHKEKPSPEENLFGECARWKNNSCCNWNTSVEINKLNLYNLDYNHCSEQGKPNISESCRKYFILDLCFIECSPNLGLWVHRDDHKVRKERVFNVPLCASECDAWFEACKDDFTCTRNWAHTFDWSSGTNKCLLGKSCRTISEEFQTARIFCEHIWDGSWEYTDDSRPCMNLTFDESKLNPNIRVSQFYLQAQSSADKAIIPRIVWILLVSVLSVVFEYP